MTALVEILLRGIAYFLIRFFWIVVLFPVAIVIATPIILVRAGLLARGKWTFRNAFADGYDNLWMMWWGILDSVL